MSGTAVASQAASVDWNIVAGAIATFFVTAWVAWSGRQKAKKQEAEERVAAPPAILTGATLQDNYSLLQSAEATRNLTQELALTRHVNEKLRDELLELRLEVERLTRQLRP